MERPKQQALAFLLGALLVGGALGFSADRVLRQDELTPAQRRAQFYEDIGITPRHVFCRSRKMSRQGFVCIRRRASDAFRFLPTSPGRIRTTGSTTPLTVVKRWS